jgi:hypothetical protein
MILLEDIGSGNEKKYLFIDFCLKIINLTFGPISNFFLNTL